MTYTQAQAATAAAEAAYKASKGSGNTAAATHRLRREWEMAKAKEVSTHAVADEV